MFWAIKNYIITNTFKWIGSQNAVLYIENCCAQVIFFAINFEEITQAIYTSFPLNPLITPNSPGPIILRASSQIFYQIAWIYPPRDLVWSMIAYYYYYYELRNKTISLKTRTCKPLIFDVVLILSILLLLIFFCKHGNLISSWRLCEFQFKALFRRAA